MSKYIRHLFAAVSIAAAVCIPAKAGNIVVNGGFESGGNWNTSGWQIGNFGHGMHSGTNSMATGCTNTGFGCYFSQDLGTTAGQSYNISFWLYTDGYVDGNGVAQGQFVNGLRVWFDEVAVRTILNFPTTNTGSSWVPGGPSTLITINNVLASSALSTLRFEGYHGPAGIYVDDVSVEAAVSNANVPEPTSLLMIGIGLAGLCSVRRRQTR